MGVPARDGILAAALAQEDIGWMNFVLGRWTPQWLTVQQAHFTRTLSKKSPKQWSIAIIHKLLLVSWDMWTYRNGLVHAPSGPLELQAHHTLNQQIDEQWTEGFAQLNKSDKHLFTDRSKEEIYNLNQNQKKQWLQDVQQARDEDNDLANQPIPMAQLQNTMADWLDSVILPGD